MAVFAALCPKIIWLSLFVKQSPRHIRRGERQFITVKSFSTSRSSMSTEMNDVRMNISNSVTILESPTKSSNDYKDYRVIRLMNGLTALLISDTKNIDADSSSCNSDSSSEDDEDGIGSSCDEEDADTSCSENEEMVDAEDGSSNKMAAGKSPDRKMAAAGLCIGVGSFSDPNDIPGLAHFVEHMVFMGSKKYPAENAFDSFIKRHGGSDNASTDCERTIFEFEVHRKHFRKALDRFAQFFIAPLMLKSSMDREIESVASEFELSLPSDDYKRQQLFGNFAVQGHPMRKFMWGNSDTLKISPSESKINVHERAVKFCKEYYSAHLMTLAVQSQETLDVLEEWVTEIFSEVPKNEISPPSFYSPSNPFDTDDFHKIYKVVPVKVCHRLYINWSLPSLLDQYRTKPLHYLWFLFGHEGKGSILSYLKKRVWALNLWVDNAESGFEHNTSYALFSVGIELTDLGLKHLFDVITAVFEYIEMLRRVGPQRRINDEMKTVADMDFQFEEEIETIDSVESICGQMQLFPPKDYLTGDELMFEYNEEIITRCLDLLLPERVNLIVSSPNFANDAEVTRIEPYYKTVYGQFDINPDWLQSWKNLNPRPDFHIPDVNEFIATEFSIVEPDCELSEYPVKILDDGLRRVWYKKDQKFNVPKAHVYFKLVSPYLRDPTAVKSVLLDLFVSALSQNMKEDVYASSEANLKYCISSDIDVSGGGLFFSVDGFHHKLHILFNTIVDHMAAFDLTDELFEAVKKELADDYYSASIKPGTLNREMRLSMIQQIHWTPVDKMTAMKNLTTNDLIMFVGEFKKRLFVEALIQGNITSKNAIQYVDTLTSKFNCSRACKTQLPEHRMLQIPLGEIYCRIGNLNLADGNSVITNYFQYGPTNIRNMCLMDLLVDIMEEPCFDILRTQEQLGYNVSCACLCSSGILGLRVTVHTQAEKFSCSKVDSRIDNFLNKFEQALGAMTQKDFETQVSSLIKVKSCVDLHLKEEVDRNWSEVVIGTYVFDRLSKEIEQLHTVTLTELKNWFKFLCVTNLRKLGVQVVGQSKKTNNVPNASSNDENKDELVDIPTLDHNIINSGGDHAEVIRELVLQFKRPKFCDGKGNTNDYVQDLNAFNNLKRRFTVFPITKVTQ